MRKCVLIACMMLFSGCAVLTKFQEMGPKQRVLWMMRAYNAEFADVQSQGQWYDVMPPAAQQILRFRAKLLLELYPLISSYIVKVEAGVEPSKAEEDVITELFERLMACDPADVEKNAPPPPDRNEGGRMAEGGSDGQ